MRSRIRIELLESFLVGRGWTRSEDEGRAWAYSPPASLGLPAGYRLFIPRQQAGSAVDSTLARVQAVLQDMYDLSEEQLNAVLSAADLVLSIQLKGRKFDLGSIPLLQFESMIDKLKKVLLNTATLVLAEGRRNVATAQEALGYLERCRFLQTETGSFVAKVQLPTEQDLAAPGLFGADPVTSNEVNERLADVLSFVTERVLHGPEHVLMSEQGIDEALELFNYDVLRDIRDLIERPAAESIVFSFLNTGSNRTISSGPLSPFALDRLDRYVSAVKERIASDLQIDVTGSIVELRSRSPDRRNNFVGIRAEFEGQEAFIALRMGKRDYPYAVMAHNRNRLVRVRGAARRLKTQLTITSLDSFEELEVQAGPGAT